MTNDTLKEFPW